MPPPRIYRTEAVVLKAYDYGEADRILTLLTPHAGSLRAVAKGVRKTSSRMAGHLDLLTRSKLLLARGRQLDIVTQAETIESYAGARGDLLSSAYATYVTELAASFSSEAQANVPLYELTTGTLSRLARHDDLEITVRTFEIQLLSVSGYRPQLHRCLVCAAHVKPGPNRFSSRMGGVLCPLCTASDAAAVPVSDDALKLLRNLQTNAHVVGTVGGIPGSVRRDVERNLQEYITYRLESRPRSLTFLDRLRLESTAQ